MITATTKNGKTAQRCIVTRFSNKLELDNCMEYKLGFSGITQNNEKYGTALQSITATNQHYIVGYSSTNDTNNAAVVSYSKTQLSETEINSPRKKTLANYGHVNGMTYSKNDLSLYFPIWSNNSQNNKYGNKYAKKLKTEFFQNANVNREGCFNFKDTKGNIADFTITGIAYDSRNKKFYTSGGKNIRIFDKEMNQEKSFKKVKKDISQDIGAFRGVIFAIENKKTETNYKNKIRVYLAKYGVWIGTYTLSDTSYVGELESITYDEFGQNNDKKNRNFVLGMNAEVDRLFLTKPEMSNKIVKTLNKYDSNIGDLNDDEA